MIKYKYSDGWNKGIQNSARFCEKKQQCYTPNNQSLPTLCALQLLLMNKPQANCELHSFVTMIAQYILNSFDADKTFVGLFRLIEFANKNYISPFLATQDYCIKILNCSLEGQIQLNISPIYHFGPEYPEDYKTKEGKELAKEAIIGLLSDDSDPSNPSTFNVGIDAGIVFEYATISHNKTMTLAINLLDDGIMANLHCEGQATSRLFTWNDLGMSSVAYADLYSQKVKNIWAA